jgi:hypothetical protein
VGQYILDDRAIGVEEQVIFTPRHLDLDPSPATGAGRTFGKYHRCGWHEHILCYGHQVVKVLVPSRDQGARGAYPTLTWSLLSLTPTNDP